MKISYNWLSSYLKTEIDVNKIGEILTNIGLEVEGIEAGETHSNSLEGVVAGKVIALEKHANADKLRVATVDVGTGETLQIVCGAPNIAEEQKVAVATVGTELTGKDGKTFKIKEAKLRGVDSFGMICSEAELGFSDNHDGIWVLEPSVKIGTPISDLVKNSTDSDVMLEIGLTPNRTDAMSHFGVARDLNAALNVLKIHSEFNASNTDEFDALAKNSNQNPIQIEIKNPELAPRYAGISLTNISIKPSPDWIQNRLKTIGLQPINNVVDITNYILHDLGQPLHAFDADKINGKKITVQTLPKGTQFKTLDGVERELNGSELMICDEKGGLCMAGIYGGLDSGVSESTQNIFLESAYFEPVTIRKGSKFHGLNTDSSFRFERGVDPNMTIIALKKAVILLTQYADAQIVGEIQDIYPNPIQNFKVVLRYHKIDQLLGERIHRERIKNILELLEIKIISESNETLEVEIPPYRADVQREVDLIEEILRIYGYNQIKTPEKMTFSVVKNEAVDHQKLENKAANYLVSLGFHEAMNNSLTKAEYQSVYGLEENEGVKMLNPLSADLAVMRQTMLSGLLENTAYNINRKNSDIKLFEIGKTYKKLKKGYEETYKLALLLSGNTSRESWTKSAQKTSFYLLKGTVEQLLKRLNLNDVKQKSLSSANFSDAISLELNGKGLGIVGIIDKKILKKADVDQDVFYAELNWEMVVQFSSEYKLQYKEISKFPAVKRDLALLLDKGISYADLYESTSKLNLDLLKSIQLFDVYEGEKLPQGKKSYALSFVLQNEEKTLADTEIEKTMNELIRNFQKNFNAELRN